MKYIFNTVCMALFCLSAMAQPDWAKKAIKSVFTLKTFSADGSLLASGNGFFVGENGEAVSSFAPFKGAAKAVAIDASGKQADIVAIIGANSTFDVAKFRVETNRSVPIAIASSAAQAGATVWLMPYSTKKKPDCQQGTVGKIENFNGSHAYYTISAKAAENAAGCPVLNENGEAIGLLQQPTIESDTVCYAVSAAFANSQTTNGLSINDQTLNSTQIKKELPNDLNQALLTLYIGSSVLDSTGYATLVGDFIAKFPNAADGYVNRAQLSCKAKRYADAEKDMEYAIKVADSKDDAHFNYAKLIYQELAFRQESPYSGWTLDKALEEARAAYRAKPFSIYRQLEAQILFAQQKYADAYETYSTLFNSDLRSAETFFAAARCKEMLRDTAATLALLDSAVCTFSKPYLKSAAPYLLARAQALLSAGEYRKAVLDFNEYESLMPNEVNANFYYVRGRAETDGHIYQAALNDFSRAISMEPTNTLYLAEKASLEIRVNLLDEAIKTSQACIDANPDLADGYLFLGLAQCLKGDKAAGKQNLQKAKDLGEPQAQALIEKYADNSTTDK